MEDRRILFARERNGPHANTQDILLAINRALHKRGEHTLLRLSYTEKGQLSGLLGEYSTSQEVLNHKDLLITTARAFDPLVIGVQPTETWIKLKVHGVSLNRYLKPRGLELANKEIKLQNKTQLPYLPRWLKPKEIL